MSDRRLTPHSGRVAHDSLRGVMPAEAYVPGTEWSVCAPLADLCASPGGPRDRQVVYGAAVLEIDRAGDWAFVQGRRDGYCGWLRTQALGMAVVPSHWVRAPASHLYSGPKVQAPDLHPLPFGARLAVLDYSGIFARTARGYVPRQHLRALGDWLDDPVAVAAQFLAAPYLWGGNSAAGLDCSALVQAAFHACGRDCPGDSDLQARHGTEVTGDLRSGDLVFWRGHVALVVDAVTLLHANGHSMSVAYEGMAQAIARIAASGGGEVTAQRRYL